jgi:hypothetical protein
VFEKYIQESRQADRTSFVAVDVIRMLIGEALRLVTDTEVMIVKEKLNSLLRDRSGEIKTFVYALRLLDTKEAVQNQTINWFKSVLNEFIVSPTHAAALSLARESVLARSTAQFEKSTEKLPLFIVPVERGNLPHKLAPGDEERKKLLASRHRYFVCIKTVKTSLPEQKIEGYVIKKDGMLQWEKTSGVVMAIQTSKEQLQFLDKTIYPSKNMKNITMSISDYSLIAEDTFDTRFDTEKNLSVRSQRKRRIFLNIPFTATLSTIDPERLIRERKNLMGVDIGEYGLAWAVVSPNSMQILGSGFIFDPQLRAIADVRAEQKMRQLQGTFTMPSSKLARLRESATTSLKNRLHALAVRYNARIVYERQVDGFESGANRVVKLYASIKQGDIYEEKDISKNIHHHYFGKNTKFIGSEVDAKGTSYLCPRCKRSVYTLDHLSVSESSGQKICVTAVDSTDDSQVEVVGFRQNLRIEQDSSSIFLKEIIKAYARPPLESVGEYSDDISKRYRGNQAIFRCPFMACPSHGTVLYDADKQAAINIAMKKVYYMQLQESENKNDKREKGTITFEDFIRWARNVREYPTIIASS